MKTSVLLFLVLVVQAFTVQASLKRRGPSGDPIAPEMLPLDPPVVITGAEAKTLYNLADVMGDNESEVEFVGGCRYTVKGKNQELLGCDSSDGYITGEMADKVERLAQTHYQLESCPAFNNDEGGKGMCLPLNYRCFKRVKKKKTIFTCELLKESFSIP